jgi:hypothetical protein
MPAFELAMAMMLGFLLKHTLMDFWVQNRFPWMWMNKGRFLHPGGITHSLTHTGGTLAILYPFYQLFEANLGDYFLWERLLYVTLAFEFLVHYFTDLFKMKICQWRRWGSNTSPRFWDMLGLDQLIHMLTYWVIIYAWIGLAVRF